MFQPPIKRDRIKALDDIPGSSEQGQLVVAFDLGLGWCRRRKCANGLTGKNNGHCAVFKFASHDGSHVLSIEPMFQRTSQGTIFRGHQKWHAIEALGKTPLGLTRETGMGEKA